MKYDSIRKQFYIEPNDVTDNSSISESDMAQEYGDGDKLRKELKLISGYVYQFIDAQYKGVNHEHHALAIRRIIKQKDRKQLSLMDAIIEYIKADLTTGMSLNKYVDGKPSVPSSVMDILRSGGLIILGDIQITWQELEGDW